jgi:hypothetical protein
VFHSKYFCKRWEKVEGDKRIRHPLLKILGGKNENT